MSEEKTETLPPDNTAAADDGAALEINSDTGNDGGQDIPPGTGEGTEQTETGDEESPALEVGEKKDNAPEGNEFTGAPENYEDFTLAEGFTFDEDTSREASELFKSLNLSQKGAQKLIDVFQERVNSFKEGQLEAWSAQQKEWRKAVKNMPDYRNQKALAERGAAKLLNTPEEVAMFKNTWLADHPVIFGIFAKVGKLYSEDSLLPQGGKPAKDGGSPEERFPVKIR